MGVPWLELTGVAGRSVATVAACAAVGAYARRCGALSESGQRELDKLVSYVYLPCLIVTKVLPNTSLKVLLDIWPLGLACLVSVLYGLLAGKIAGKHYKGHGGLIAVAVAFPNSFSVPLTLALALGDEPSLLMTGEKLADRVNFLFVMSYSLWTLARWSVGYPVLTGAFSLKEWRRRVANPPVLACLGAFVLGLAWDRAPSPLRQSVLDSPALTSVSTAFEYAGRCSVPSILMTLGARLEGALAMLLPARKGSRKATSSSAQRLLEAEAAAAAQEQPAPLPASGYFLVLLLRQGIGPLLGVAVNLGLVRGVLGVRDPVLLLVGMLQSAGPPMVNLATMSGLSRTAEHETARLLLLTYGCSVLTWTASIALFLALL